MKSWIIGWHPASQENQRYEFRCLSGDTEEEALDFLRATVAKDRPEEESIVVRWCVPKPPARTQERTCGYCHQTREEVIPDGPLEPPGFFTSDKHLWRPMLLR